MSSHRPRLLQVLPSLALALTLAPSGRAAGQAVAAATHASALAGDSGAATADSGTLEARIEELDQKIRVLERLRELEREQAEARAREAPAFTAGREGFALRSADGAFQIRFRGYTQTDGRFFDRAEGSPLASTFTMRRVRPIIEGTLHRHVDFRIMPDFGGGSAALFDAHIDIRLHPALALRAGKYKPPVGLERLQSATDLLFVERGLPTNLVPTRDVGLQLSGEAWRGTIGWQAGIFNGAPDLANGDNDAGNGKDVDARVLVQPFRAAGPGAPRGLALGVAASRGIHRGAPTAAALPTYRSPAQQAVFAYRADATAAGTAVAGGEHVRIAPQGYLHAGRFGLLGEYVVSRQAVRRDTSAARLSHASWQLAGSMVITGESPGIRGLTPRRPFDPASGQWGAFELGARVGALALDDDAFPTFADPARAVRAVRAWGIALNWYLARGIRVQANYEHSSFTGGAANDAERAPEKAILTRFQFAF